MPSKVFTSYTRESREHMDRVLKLSNRLREEGVDAEIDQYEEAPKEGWPRWMLNQIEEADFVLVICTSTYDRRFRGKGDGGKGLGSKWEGAVITTEIYQDAANNSKFIPIVFATSDAKNIPLILRATTYYDLSTEDGYIKLYRRLLGLRPPKPPLGQIQLRPPDQIRVEGGLQPLEASSQPESLDTTTPAQALNPRLRNQNFPTPLSAKAYAVIALVGFGIAIGLLFFYIYEVPKLVESGSQNQIFYLLLIPWALSCAAFLFGAMQSYARFTYKEIGNALELGGPVVLFCLVLAGGFKLVPPPPESFDLTVRAHSAEGNEPIISSGKVTVDVDTDRRTEPFGSNGEANFKGIPAKFSVATLTFLPQVPNYEETPQSIKLGSHVVDLPLERAHPKSILRGSIALPLPTSASDINILMEGGQGKPVHPDEFGSFELPVEGKDGESIRLKIFVNGKSLYDDYQTLPGPVTIKLHKPK